MYMQGSGTFNSDSEQEHRPVSISEVSKLPTVSLQRPQACLYKQPTFWTVIILWKRLSHPSSCMLVNHGPSQQSSKEEYKLWKEMLPQDTTHLIQRPCYQWESLCQDPAGNQTTQRPDHRKKMQTAVVWSCLSFIRSGQIHLARHSERGEKTRQAEEEVGRQHQGMEKSGVRQVKEGSGEQGKMEETGCKIICGAPATLAVKE